VRQTFYEVGGAIQWIDNPLNILIFTSVFTAFFGDDGVLRVRFANGFDNHRLGGFIDVGHKSLLPFWLVSTESGFRSAWQLNYPPCALRAHGDVQHRMHRSLSLDVKEREKTAHIITVKSAYVSVL
jgi:hypothetical protein